MDNSSFEFIPEPSSLLLTVAGALLLWPLLRRKQAKKIRPGYAAGTKP